MRVRVFIGLFLFNLIWSAHPVVGKWLLLDMSPILAAWTRYGSALLGYLILVVILLSQDRLFNLRPRRSWKDFFLIPESHLDKMLIIIIGMTTFCFSPLFHMKGLSTSLATENAIIVAMEPLVTIFLAWLLLKETVSWFDILGFGFALLGFGFLAGNSPSEIGSAANVGNDLGTHLIGNLLIVCSILGESSFTLLGKKLVSRYSPISVFGSAMAVGFMGLTVAVIGMTPSGSIGMHFEMFTGRWHWKTVFAALWIGPLGTTAGYLFYLSALADTSVVAITLFLFLQPLAGAFMGYLFLNERLHEWQGLGSFFILIAILLPNAIRLRRVSALSAQI